MAAVVMIYTESHIVTFSLLKKIHILCVFVYSSGGCLFEFW